jgi:hypothetical protein
MRDIYTRDVDAQDRESRAIGKVLKHLIERFLNLTLTQTGLE